MWTQVQYKMEPADHTVGNSNCQENMIGHGTYLVDMCCLPIMCFDRVDFPTF